MIRRTKIVLLSAGVLLLLFLVVGVVYRPSIPEVNRPSGFPASEVTHGARLAAIGDCVVCHTAEAGVSFAGGRALATPFGTLYATNITPDETTGIGRWSPAAFRRAMKEGISRDGTHLYPALPYEHFSRVADQDLDAIYAFLMSLPPTHAPTPPNELIFPLGFRPLLAGWKLLFLHPEPIRTIAGQSPEWNRGRYLVEGLGHCGGCHTPRNLAGAEKPGQAFQGGIAEGWNAPALSASNPSPALWSIEALVAYLRTGFDAAHSAAGGPMGPVTHGLAQVPESEVRAIATYIASLGGPRDAKAVDRREDAAAAHPAGAALFAGACSGCHEDGAPMAQQNRPSLSLVSALQSDDPRNALNAVLEGIPLPADRRGAYMPAFSTSLNDAQVIQIVAYLRARFSTRPAWSGLDNAVAAARKEGTQP